MIQLDMNIDKLTKTAEIPALSSDLLMPKYSSINDINSQLSENSQTNKDSLDINNKGSKFILKNSITNFNTNISSINVDPDPRLKMLKYLFKEIYGIEISGSIKTYKEAVNKYNLKSNNNEI